MSDKINRYKIRYNDEGYVEAVIKTDGEDFDYEGQISFMPDICHGWYKMENGTLIVDEAKKAQIEKIRSDAQEILDLKAKLKNSDGIIAETFESILSLDNSVTFIVDFIRILREFRAKYSVVLANRKVWRARLEELED